MNKVIGTIVGAIIGVVAGFVVGLFGESLSCLCSIFGTGTGGFDGDIMIWILGAVGAIIGFFVGYSSDKESTKPEPVQPPKPRPQRTQRAQNLDDFLRELNGLNNVLDNTAVKDNDFYLVTQKTQQVATRIKNNAPTNINLGLDALYSQVDKLVVYANRIAANANPRYFRKGSENFEYDERLWYRAKLAGEAFLRASELVKQKLNQLHKIAFEKVSDADRKEIMQLQSDNGLIAWKRGLIEDAKMMFRTNRNIKELIRNHCGPGGKAWAERMDKSGEEARDAERYKRYWRD